MLYLSIAVLRLLSRRLVYWVCGGMAEGLRGDAELTVAQLSDLHLASSGGIQETPWVNKIIIGGYKLHKPCIGKSFHCHPISSKI